MNFFKKNEKKNYTTSGSPSKKVRKIKYCPYCGSQDIKEEPIECFFEGEQPMKRTCKSCGGNI